MKNWKRLLRGLPREAEGLLRSLPRETESFTRFQHLALSLSCHNLAFSL
jgi:hypothetical protein